MVVLDATVFPSNALLLRNALNTMQTVINMVGANGIAHVQLPIQQSNTTSQAVMKHRRAIEDSFMAGGFDPSYTTVLDFARPANATAADQRHGLQQCLALLPRVRAPTWTAPGVVGALPLIRVCDMLGYDPDSRPGATARAEQKLGDNMEIFNLNTGVAGSCFEVKAFLDSPCFCFKSRKGVEAHAKIIDAYIAGLQRGQNDKVLIFDVLPNRWGYLFDKKYKSVSQCRQYKLSRNCTIIRAAVGVLHV